MMLIDPATCLAVAIYFESRGELQEHQMKVAEVVMNRVESKKYPNTICKVVKQYKQFSFLNDAPDTELVIDKKSIAWQTAKRLASVAMRAGGKSTDACHYAHADIDNFWTKKMDGKKEGNHVFYKGGC